MNILYRNSQNEVIFSNLNEICMKCEEACTSEGSIIRCPIFTNDEIRQGKKQNAPNH